MGMHWVPKWIELERKWRFLKHSGPEGGWNEESWTLLCQGGLSPVLAKALLSMAFSMVCFEELCYWVWFCHN